MMENNPQLKYEFADNGGGEEIGFNDSVTTSFKGNIAYFLARESIQNIIDAAVAHPVRAEFELMTVPANNLPNFDHLMEIFMSCRDYYDDKKSKEFFQRASDTLAENNEIPILRIGDYNTKGLTGSDDDRNGNYYNFLKSSGSSAKKEGTGGSFGLGKGAYYAASSMHTIFVSSIYDSNQHVFQGKLRLVTHELNGAKKQSTGSFGLEGQKPVRNPDIIPEQFKRTQQGTDIFVVGFYQEGNLEEQISRSVLNNFWLAILKGVLVVKVNGLEINNNNLRELMFKNFREENKDTVENPNPLPAFMAYTDKENNKIFKKNLYTLGEVELRILPKESFHKKVSYFRKTGMEIQKKTHHSIVPYAGVFYCEDFDGNEVLRLMENPQHNLWDAYNAREKGQEWFEKAKKADKEMKGFVKESLRELYKSDQSTALTIPELDQYLYIEEDEEGDLQGDRVSEKAFGDVSNTETGSEVGAEKEFSDREVEVIKPLRVVKKKEKYQDTGDDDMDSEKSKRTTPPGTITREPWPTSTNEIDEEKADKEGRFLKNIKSRSFAIAEGPDINHVIILKSDYPNIKINIVLAVGTEDSFEAPKITEAYDSMGNKLSIDKNKICGIKLDNSGGFQIRVKFKINERYALNISAYENR